MPGENLKSGEVFIEAGKLQAGAKFVKRAAPEQAVTLKRRILKADSNVRLLTILGITWTILILILARRLCN